MLSFLIRLVSAGLVLLIVLLSRPLLAQRFAGYSASAQNQSLTLPKRLPDLSQADYGGNNRRFDKANNSDSSSLTSFELMGITVPQWSVGVLADGDFSKALTDRGVAPRTGQLGFTALRTSQIWPLRRELRRQLPQGSDSRQLILGKFNYQQQYIDSLREKKGAEYGAYVTEQRKAVNDAAQKVYQAQQDTARWRKALRRYTSVVTPIPSHPVYARLRARSRATLTQRASQSQLTYLKAQTEYEAFLDRLSQAGTSPYALKGLPTLQAALAQARRDSAAAYRPPLKPEGEPKRQKTAALADSLYQLIKPIKNALEKLPRAEAANAPAALEKYAYTLLNAQNQYRADTAKVNQAPVDLEEFKLVKQNAVDSLQRGLTTADTQLTTLAADLRDKQTSFDRLRSPFLPPRSQTRLVLDLIISLGNLGDSVVAQTAAAPATGITNRQLFGSSLLVPGSVSRAGRAVTASMVWYPITRQKVRLGTLAVDAFFNYSSTIWYLPGTTPVAEQVGILSFSTGLQYDIFDIHATPASDGTAEGNDVKFAVLLNGSYRNIGGEAGRNANFRQELLGTVSRDFYGLEPGLLLSVSNFRVSFTYPVFYGKYIRGFSKGYPVVGFGFSTALQAGKSDRADPRAWTRLAAVPSSKGK